MKNASAQVGIYKIVSPKGKVYIGQSRRISRRFSDYKCLHNCSEQRLLFNSFMKYGVSNHTFSIIHPCEESQLNDLEKYYIELYQSTKRQHGLNIMEGGIGNRHHPETIEKIRTSNLGKKMSEESRRKMSEAKKGKSPWNKGLKGSQVAWNKGRPWNDKHKERLRTMNLGRKMSEEEKKKRSESLKGRRLSDDHRKKLSEAAKNRNPVSDKTKEKMRQSRLNHIKNQQNGKQQ